MNGKLPEASCRIAHASSVSWTTFNAQSLKKHELFTDHPWMVNPKASTKLLLLLWTKLENCRARQTLPIYSLTYRISTFSGSCTRGEGGGVRNLVKDIGNEPNKFTWPSHQFWRFNLKEHIEYTWSTMRWWSWTNINMPHTPKPQLASSSFCVKCVFLFSLYLYMKLMSSNNKK